MEEKSFTAIAVYACGILNLLNFLLFSNKCYLLFYLILCQQYSNFLWEILREFQ